MEELLKSLIWIQQNLNAPKDLYNSFGKYKYRSLEGIQAAIKPLLLEQGCGIRFADEVVEHCGRTFLKTTLYFFNDKGQSITTTAEAEHSASKSGMDSAQITGAASSYARKYCMNAMFCIDDSQDADSNEYQNQQTNASKKAAARRTATPAPQPIVPTPNVTLIENELKSVTDMGSLIKLYNLHKSEVENSDAIKALFTQKKLELKAA